MKLLIDNADISNIMRLYEFYPIDGVTTNPSILAATGKHPIHVIDNIRACIGGEDDLHVQVISAKAEEMIEEGRAIAERFGKEHTYIKVPVDQEGLKVIRILSEDGYLTTGTAVYSIQQAYLAGKAGAKYVAPYVNRIDNLGEDGVNVARRIHSLFQENNMDTQVLAASFKNTRQIMALAESGIGAATATPELIEGLLKNAEVDGAISKFRSDFEKLCGPGKTMLDLMKERRRQEV